MRHPTLYPLRLPWPVDWTDTFGRRAPLLLEIGFGSGHFLVDLAERQPAADVIGLEISLPSLRRGERKVRRQRLANVRLLLGEAVSALWVLFAPASLDAIYINFPDPWPKARHHHRRLINGRFLALAASRMHAGGRLAIATDHADYAAWIADHLNRSPYFASQTATPYVTADPGRLVTKYERLALAAGRTCHYFHWQRSETAVTDSFPVPPEQPMPHVILATPLTLDAIHQAFAPHQQSAGDIHVRFLEMYAAGRADLLLVEANVNETPLAQRVALTISRRAEGELLVGLHELGFPRPTPGVHQAIAFLAGWLLSLAPEGQLRHSNLQPDVLLTA